ncbi:uncharacterized protein LOC142920213 isoform X2 [Petromyzon marinus]|uniref:uncharacterized protein LOC142920213 isoform X2 n=1 Tax=Petromyzon marinus TaxID=7757 RepID=UPI003F727447
MASGFVRTASLYSSSSRRRRRRRLGSLPGSLLAVCVAATAVYAVVTAHEGRGQPQRPSLQDGLPANVTAVVGSDAQLRCVVLKQGGDGGDEHHHQHQQHHHHVQWLKHVEVNGSLEAPNSSPYVRIVTTVGVEVTDVETNVLYLRNVSTDDSGRYTCLAVNAVGFARRSAWLLVVPAGGRTLAATTTAGAGKMLTASPAMFPDVSVTVEAVSAAPLTAGDVSCTTGFLLLTAIAGVAAFCLTQTRRARRESTGGEVEMQQ